MYIYVIKLTVQFILTDNNLIVCKLYFHYVEKIGVGLIKLHLVNIEWHEYWMNLLA